MNLASIVLVTVLCNFSMVSKKRINSESQRCLQKICQLALFKLLTFSYPTPSSVSPSQPEGLSADIDSCIIMHSIAL
jgi:hypothetical protein